MVGKNNDLTYKDDIGTHIEMSYPKDVIIIKRYDLLKCILTIDENKKDKEITKYLDLIISKYPIVKKIGDLFKDFHDIMFSKNPDLLDKFISNYDETIPSFCNGLKKNIAPVKNAISYTINSGFVEGNNNKFKLIKRIVYGKEKLVNLFKKSYLCFLATTDNFNIEDIVEGILSNNKK